MSALPLLIPLHSYAAYYIQYLDSFFPHLQFLASLAPLAQAPFNQTPSIPDAPAIPPQPPHHHLRSFTRLVPQQSDLTGDRRIAVSYRPRKVEVEVGLF
jgi:hypothetical protein